MRSFKGILLTGTAILALVACSSDKGPGKIGSIDDIVVRNAGEKSALPPPGAEPVKQVQINPAATEGDTAAPSAAEVIAAEDTGTKQTVEQAAAAAQAAQKNVIADAHDAAQTAVAHPQALAEQAASNAADVAAPVVAAAENAGTTATTAAATAAATVPDTAPGVNWNQPRRIASQEEADALVEEQMAQSAPPAADVLAAASAPATAPAPLAPPAADVVHAQATPTAPKIPVTAPENYTQDPNAPYSPAAARAAAAAQTGTPVDAPAPASAASAPTQAAPVPMTLARVDGAMPLDPAVLQAKDPASVRSLQKTLADAGFYKGALNGEMNSDTLNAYVKYQSAAQASQAAAAPAPAPAPTPVAPAPAPPPAEIAPTPVMEQMPAQAAPEMLTQDAPGMSSTAPAPLSQRRAVSRRTPAPLPAVEPYHAAPSHAQGNMTAAPAPSVAPAQVATPSAPAPAAAPAAFGANVSMSDPAVISAAQRALAAKGLYTGAMNGTVDANTLNALVRYQASNGLTPGMLNIETLKSLGVVAQ